VSGTRIIAIIFNPELAVVLALLIGAVLLWTPWRRGGAILVGLVAAFFAALMLLPLGIWLAQPLEGRFPPRQSATPNLAGIIGLTGVSTDSLSARYGKPALDDDGERLVTLIALAQRHPDLPVVLTGDGVDATLRALLREFAVPDGRIRLAGQAATTAASAVALKADLGPAATGRWLLVTSAMHMPRAVGAFRVAGWDVVAYPVDFRAPSPQIPPGWPTSPAKQWRLLRDALYEWGGLTAYYLLGRTDAWLPAP